jgi:hypothetical protein
MNVQLIHAYNEAMRFIFGLYGAAYYPEEHGWIGWVVFGAGAVVGLLAASQASPSESEGALAGGCVLVVGGTLILPVLIMLVIAAFRLVGRFLEAAAGVAFAP